MIQVEFRATIDPPWTAMAPVQVGFVPPGHGSPAVFVIVERDSVPLLRVDVYAEDCFCAPRQDAIVWGDLVAIGFGARLHFASLASRTNKTWSLGGYFGAFYLLPSQLLVADAERLHCFDQRGALVWRSDVVGCDGVVVEKVEQGLIEGSGEWDPPGGWKPFRLSLASGRANPA